MTALTARKADWVDRRKAPPRADYDQLLSDIITVAKDLPTYGYRRVWAILKFQGVDGSPRMVNHKRVYRVRRDNNLLFRHGNKPDITCRHDGKVAVQISTPAGVRMVLDWLVTTVRKFAWPLPRIAVTARS